MCSSVSSGTLIRAISLWDSLSGDGQSARCRAEIRQRETPPRHWDNDGFAKCLLRTINVQRFSFHSLGFFLLFAQELEETEDTQVTRLRDAGRMRDELEDEILLRNGKGNYPGSNVSGVSIDEKQNQDVMPRFLAQILIPGNEGGS
jgi:hypothetical protein